MISGGERMHALTCTHSFATTNQCKLKECASTRIRFAFTSNTLMFTRQTVCFKSLNVFPLSWVNAEAQWNRCEMNVLLLFKRCGDENCHDRQMRWQFSSFSHSNPLSVRSQNAKVNWKSAGMRFPGSAEYTSDQCTVAFSWQNQPDSLPPPAPHPPPPLRVELECLVLWFPSNCYTSPHV